MAATMLEDMEAKRSAKRRKLSTKDGKPLVPNSLPVLVPAHSGATQYSGSTNLPTCEAQQHKRCTVRQLHEYGAKALRIIYTGP
jgi:hypothetical protein